MTPEEHRRDYQFVHTACREFAVCDGKAWVIVSVDGNAWRDALGAVIDPIVVVPLVPVEDVAGGKGDHSAPGRWLFEPQEKTP